MKIAAIYANAAPQLISLVEGELKRSLRDEKPLYIMTRSDPSLLADTVEAGYVKASTARRLIKMYMDAANDGADIIYSVSSAMGDVAFNAIGMFGKLGIRLVRIDELMVEAAVEQGSVIGIVATQRASLEPCKRMLMRCAAAKGKEIECIDILAENAYGKMRDETAKLIAERAASHIGDIDVFILAQESLALCEWELQDLLDKPVLSSPRYGAMAVRQTVIAMRSMEALPGDTETEIHDVEEVSVEEASSGETEGEVQKTDDDSDNPNGSVDVTDDEN